jgi:hypothetical protein
MRIVKQLGLAGALAGTLAMGSCSTMGGTKNQGTWSLKASDTVPAAQGKVLVQPQKNGNTNLKVQVAHLAEPGTAYAGASTYVVWLKPTGGAPQNLGPLHLDKNKNAELNSTTPFKTFDIMVTAESQPNVTWPSMNQVFNASVEVPT